jgi:N-sulfoglucosamine sulfohydrolase
LLRDKAGYYTGICGRTAHLDGNARASALSGEIYERHRLSTMAERVDFVDRGPDGEIAARFAAFLDGKPADRPFFMWANFSDPHHPWDAEVAMRPDPAMLDLPPQWPDLPGLRADFAAVCGEVNRLDRTIGAVLDVVRQRGLHEKTVIVFCGDNGTALPRGKGSLHDPGCHVPFIVHWPGVVAPRGESRALISGEDVAPTLLAAAGVAPPPGMTGRSFLPLLAGKPFEPRRHVFMERGPHGNAAVTVDIATNGYDLGRAVRSDRWKLIYNCTPWVRYKPIDSAGNPGWTQLVAAHAEGRLPEPFAAAYFAAPRAVYELYDLHEDPGELRNLAGRPKHAATQRELATALYEKMILDGDYLPLPEIPAIDEAAAQGRPARADE